jgi:LysM repeat protein
VFSVLLNRKGERNSPYGAAKVKLFFVLLFFLFFIALFAGGAVGDMDLTPDTPPDPNRPTSVAPAFMTNNSNNRCGREYTVRSGDTLSAIARDCGITLQELLAANPTIANPNLIQVNQRINIPGGSSLPPQNPPPVPNTQPLPTQPLPTSAVVEATPTDEYYELFLTAAASSKNLPATKTPQPPSSFQPGGQIMVDVEGLFSNTEYHIAIGQVDQEPENIGRGISNSDGTYTAPVQIPARAKAGEKWVVTFITVNHSDFRVTSKPFVVK